jgi:hypothetical protein
MKRNCSLSDISDGKFYHIDDLVNVSCNGCKGKASCCHGMGNSIVLDPFDIFRITNQYEVSFEQLMVDKIELNLVDGLILPNLKMTETTDGCSFLNDKGRCTIHGYRPSICRIFPLGRYYENQFFHYILQTNECKNTAQTKMKVGKWIDTSSVNEDEKFVIDWHYFLKDVEDIIINTRDENQIRNITMYVLHMFYIKKYTPNANFYEQFNERLTEAKQAFNIN